MGGLGFTGYWVVNYPNLQNIGTFARAAEPEVAFSTIHGLLHKNRSHGFRDSHIPIRGRAPRPE